MTAQRTDVYVRFLGAPSFVLGGRTIHFPTRKSMALCTYLAANGGRKVERLSLAGLLWTNSSTEHARISLRKALSLVFAVPDTAALLGKDRPSVWYAGDPAASDLAEFDAAIAANTEDGYRAALGLWRGLPLDGLELGEDLFDDWVATFRNDTVALTHRRLGDRLAAMRRAGSDARREIALCELIVRIEPADTAANERLIHLLAEAGDTAGAMRRYAAYARELKNLDVAVPAGLNAYAARLRQPAGRPDDEAPVAAPRGHGRPSVEIVRTPGRRTKADLFSYAHAEVVRQLSRFRSMRCFDGSDFADADAAITGRLEYKLQPEVSHDYRLILWEEPDAQSIYLRCVNAHRLETVSVTRLHHQELAERSTADTIVASAINSIEQDILNDEPDAERTPFGRWLAAYHDMAQFTPSADARALRVLEGLAADPAAQRLSLVYSAIGSIYLKRRLYVPSRSGQQDDLARADDSVHRALALDQLEPFNHIMLGWLRIQRREFERAMAAFDAAVRLNPFAARTLMAAAEASALCGDLEQARRLSDKAMTLSGRYVPPYFYGYRASIEYLAGDLDACVSTLHHSPDNLSSAVLAVAAHQERGDRAAASEARAKFESELRALEANEAIGVTALSNWIEASNLARDASVGQRLFAALEGAGVALQRPAAASF